MREKPILLNTEMVRAILDGRKTATRRVMKPQPRTVYHDGKLYQEDNCLFLLAENHDGGLEQIVSPYNPGDTLYVRETFAEMESGYLYKADFSGEGPDYGMRWCPSIHMPKEAARIFLRVTDVSVERLQDISREDARKEGFDGVAIEGQKGDPMVAKLDFANLWDSTIKKTDLDKYGWAANPWVWVIEFEKISKEEALGNDQRRSDQFTGRKQTAK